jgi:thiol-disulfide isomerase/thioredoxin
VLPLGDELVDVAGDLIDPVGDGAARRAPGLLHKYQGRALLIATGSCAVHEGTKKWMMLAIAAVVVLLIGFMISGRDEEKGVASEKVLKSEITTPVSEEKKTENMTAGKSEDVMMPKVGSYIPYDASKLAMAKEERVVLFFRASWCPTCRALDADIKKNLSAIPTDVTILDVDYDRYVDLKKQYGITTQHTLVQVDADGEELGKWVGSATLAELVKNVK